MRLTTAARNAIGPLLDQLIKQLDVEGRATQRAHFDRIRRCLYGAQFEAELTRPILDLSTSTAVGFRFSTEADALINRILEKAEALAKELDEIQSQQH